MKRKEGEKDGQIAEYNKGIYEGRNEQPPGCRSQMTTTGTSR